MSEVLSQSEIDKLFLQMSSGEIDVDDIQENSKEKIVKLYDFTRPSKFSKDHLRTLEVIFENYSRVIGNFLSGYLRTIVPIEVVSAEALTFREYSNSLPNPLLLGILDFKPLKGSVILEVSPMLGFCIIDKILGGKGDTIGKVREFTNIEKVILNRIFEKLTDLLAEPWKNVIPLSANLDKVETNPQVVQVIPPNEMIALVTLKATVGQNQGMINICLPYLVLEPIMDKLNTKHWFSHETALEESSSKEVQKTLEEATVTVRAVLGETTVNTRDILNLEKNDIIKLDTCTNSAINVYVGDLLKFAGSPGCKNNKAAIKINSVLKGDE